MNVVERVLRFIILNMLKIFWLPPRSNTELSSNCLPTLGERPERSTIAFSLSTNVAQTYFYRISRELQTCYERVTNELNGLGTT